MVIALALVGGIVGHPHVARAATDPLDALLEQSGGGGASTDAATDTSSSSTADSTTVAAVSSGPAIIPAVTPLVVQEYSTDPAQLQSGSRFVLSLTINNPGKDAADDVVVQIGPSSDGTWGSKDELVVIGTGNAKYVGSIGAGASDDTVSFQLIANPAAPGGLRSVPVKLTWKSQGYEHTASGAVGLLVNSFVALDTTVQVPSSPVQKERFETRIGITNTTRRTIRDVHVVFSGEGARPSKSTSVTVGDIAPGATWTVPMAYIAPLVGRAKVIADVSYTDDFGDLRTWPVEAWVHVQRASSANDTSGGLSLAQVVTAISALLGLNG
jgi:hypothetical protein